VVKDAAEQVRVAAREAELWAQIWRIPVAVMWEPAGWTTEVAFYVRALVVAEAGDVKSLAELRQWSDRLGLNPAAMLRNRWKVATDEVAAQRARPVAVVPVASLRDRARRAEGQ
jgi:hypothetical protein